MPTDPEAQAKPQAKPGSNLRGRLGPNRKSPGRKPSGVTARPSPTRSIEPGPVHFHIAEGILRRVQRETAERLGQPLDVGEFPTTAEVVAEGDPQLIAKHTAHAVARFGDRFGFVRRFSRHFEGTNNRAGVLSDLSSALVALYRRNPEVFKALAQQLGQDVQERRAQAKAKQNGGTVTPAEPQTQGANTRANS